MKKTATAVHQQPVWIAALLASAEGRKGDTPLRHRVVWESGRAALRVTNGGSVPVFIRPLGVELGAGSRVEVRWPAGATGYEFEIVRNSRRTAA
jgi:hypothetical protein